MKDIKKQIISCFRVTGMELLKGIKSVKFWLITSCFVLLMLLDTLPELYAESVTEANGQRVFGTDIISMSLNTANGTSYLFWLRFCLFVIPYGCCFYEEYSMGAAKYRAVRSSCVNYGITKLLTCTILTSLSIWFAEAAYAVIMLLQGVKLILPSIGEGEPNYYLYRFIAEGNYIGFLFLLSIFKCFAGIFFSAMTLALSAFIRNKYILIAMPLTVFFSLDSFSGLWFDNGLTQPEWLNWRVLFFSMTDGGVMTEISAVIRTMIYTLASIFIFGLIFIGRIKRVVENE